MNDCDRCGEPHAALPRCQGHAKATGKQCKRTANPGGTVCVKHGSAAPQVRAANARRVQQAEARKAYTRWAEHEPPANVDPVDALIGEFRRTCAVVAYLDTIVGADGHEDAFETKVGIVLDPVVVWWQDERDRMRNLVTALHKMGIDERQTRVAEAQAVQLVDVIRRVVDALGLTAEQRTLVPNVVRTAIAAVTAAER